MSRVWMLFESGRAATVKLTLHDAHPETGRPIDAYLITEGRGEVTTAARRGAEAAYAWCRGYDPKLPASVVSFDIAGLDPHDALGGGSGGLAFALALALRLRPLALPGDLAATGEILSGHDGGPIGPVAGIRTKLQAAGEKLPPGSLLFYPGDHQGELPRSLLDELQAGGLELCPVTSVVEALKKLYSDPIRQTPGLRRMSYAALALLPLALAVFGTRYHLWPPPGDSGPPAIRTADHTSGSGNRFSATSSILPNDIEPTDPASKNLPAMGPPLQIASDVDTTKTTIPAVTAPPTDAPASTKPADKPVPAASGAAINLIGDSDLARNLAARIARRLEDALPSNTYLSGEVAIVAVSEHEEAGRRISSLTAILHQVVLSDPTGRYPLPQQSATANGFGPAAERLPAIARQMAAKLLDRSTTPVPPSGGGFD